MRLTPLSRGSEQIPTGISFSCDSLRGDEKNRMTFMSFASPRDSLLPFWLYCTTELHFCQYLFVGKINLSGQAREFPAPVRLSSSPEKELKDHAVEDRSTDPEDQHGSGDHEHLGPYAHDQPLWLCQDRHTVFSEFFQLPPKCGALIVLACRYKFKPARSTHIYLNLS